MKTYDVVIPYKHKDGLELKYCLKGIEGFLVGYRRIFLVGTEFPSWYKGQTIYCPDVPGRKQLSIFNKLLAACNSEVSEDFIMFNDDHFLLKLIEVTEIKNWTSGTMSKALEKARGKYYTAILNTMEELGGDRLYYDIHAPCIYNKEKFKGLQGYDWSKELVIKSLYFNTYPCEKAAMTDCKINIPMTREGIEEKIKDRLFFSTGPNGMKIQMKKKLEELYSEKIYVV